MEAGTMIHHYRSTLVTKVCATVLLIGVSVGGAARPPAGPADIPMEYRLKAAFLYKFLDFVEWPPGAPPASGTQIEIGIVGDGPIVNALLTLTDQVPGGRSVAVKQLSSAREVGSSDVVFVSHDLQEDVGTILGELSDAPVLTVGDAGDFISRGGMIRFYIENKKLRLEISPEAAERAGLKISSRLLRLAKITEGSRGR